MASLLRQNIRRIRKRIEMMQLRYRANFGRFEELAGYPRATVIVQSFARPQNIELIVKIALRCRFVERVIVSNNNPDIDLTKWVRISEPRYTLILQERKMPCGTRFDIARNTTSQYFICLDDDIFLRPDQIAALYTELLQDSSVPHGLFAEIWTKNQTPDGEAPVLRGGTQRFEGHVDVLNCVMAFSRQHLERYFEILESMGKSDALDIGVADDVVISSSGSGQAKCHDVGRILICPTARDPGIALWQQEGFKSYRTSIFKNIRAGA